MSSEKIVCPQCGCYNTVTSDNCWKCKRKILDEEKRELIDKISEENNLAKKKLDAEYLAEIETWKVQLERAKNTGNWGFVSDDARKWASDSILVTSSHLLGSAKAFKEIDVIAVEVVFGMNLIKDVFKSIRDIVGGRSDTVEKLMRDTRKTAMSELREEALMLQADAIIAVKFDYVEIGGGNGNMILMVASGTAVKYV